MSDALTSEERALVEAYRAEKLQQTARRVLAEEEAARPFQYENIRVGMTEAETAAAWAAIRKALSI